MGGCIEQAVHYAKKHTLLDHMLNNILPFMLLDSMHYKKLFYEGQN